MGGGWVWEGAEGGVGREEEEGGERERGEQRGREKKPRWSTL